MRCDHFCTVLAHNVLASDMCNSHGMMHGGCAAFMIDWSVSYFEGIRVMNISDRLAPIQLLFNGPRDNGPCHRESCGPCLTVPRNDVPCWGQIVSTTSLAYWQCNGPLPVQRG